MGDIIQADREAAARLYPLVSRAPTDTIPKAMIKGDMDDSHVVQALATHRRAAVAELVEAAAKIAEEQLVEIYDDSPEIDTVCNTVVREIASNIRSLSRHQAGLGKGDDHG